MTKLGSHAIRLVVLHCIVWPGICNPASYGNKKSGSTNFVWLIQPIIFMMQSVEFRIGIHLILSV